MTFEEREPKRFRIVAAVAGFDDTDSSSFVVEAASSRARAIVGAELHLVHVVEERAVALTLSAILGPWTSIEKLEHGRAYLEGMQRLAEGSFRGSVRAHLAKGEPWHEIVNVAERLDADLVVVGKRSPVGLADRQSSIVSDLVAGHASCRVLVARPGTGSARTPAAPPLGST